MPSSQESKFAGYGRGLPNPRIGGPLQALLDARFFTHAELAREIKVHEQNVSRWCRNETGPQKRQVRAIAEFFGVEPASLIDHEYNERMAA